MNIDFLKYKFIFIFLSSVLVLTAIFGMFTKKFQFGIDFTGGVEMTVTFEDEVTLSELENLFSSQGYSISLQSVNYEKPRFFIRSSESLGEENIQDEFTNILQEHFGDKFIIDESTIIGSIISGDNQINIIKALIISIVIMILYLSLRFHFLFAISAIIALLHDLLIMSFFVIFLNKEFNIFTITAFLTIFGYSINDTIILFDRIREYMREKKYKTLEEIIYFSINGILSRTIITSLTTLFVVASLYLFSQGTIKDLAFSLIIGVLSGTYSTIFIATSSLLFFNKKGKVYLFYEEKK